MKKASLILLAILFSASAVFAQDGKEMKQRKSAHDTVKSANVTVTYGRPAKKGRSIFGGLVPYGEVWRTGADEATEITFKKDGMFGGKEVKAGTYTLFTIPEEGKWTIILNSQLKQWGSFGYDKIKDKDVLHVDAPITHGGKAVEKFTIEVKKSELLMEWDQTSVSVPMKF